LAACPTQAIVLLSEEEIANLLKEKRRNVQEEN
jgi:Fe-S-cluster-containing hydrogenase component 2